MTRLENPGIDERKVTPTGMAYAKNGTTVTYVFGEEWDEGVPVDYNITYARLPREHEKLRPSIGKRRADVCLLCRASEEDRLVFIDRIGTAGTLITTESGWGSTPALGAAAWSIHYEHFFEEFLGLLVAAQPQPERAISAVEDHLKRDEAATTTALRGHEVEDALNSLRIRRKAYRDTIIELRSFESL